jgi:hypothetical protein
MGRARLAMGVEPGETLSYKCQVQSNLGMKSIDPQQGIFFELCRPSSCVTAGGDQDSADGGLDVRIECPSDFLNPDFVPRRLTGFQVRKPDMLVSAIRNEMAQWYPARRNS